MKKTKIVCTLGPASNDLDTMRKMLKNGMNAVRVNMSHGNHSQLKGMIQIAKKISDESETALATVADTQGPEIRIGKLHCKRLNFIRGDHVLLKEGNFLGNEKVIPLTYQGLGGSLNPGDRILIGDGEVELEVLRAADNEIECEVNNSGVIEENKGIHIRGGPLAVSAITDKDREDIRFVARQEVDYLALSFVREAADILRAREILDQEGGKEIEIIAKIESGDAWSNIDEILETADGIMVARGDLGLEIDPEEIPSAQKNLINKANEVGKPVITATQMLESMTHNPRPTRAEVTDVANAILDGTDAVMLSQETAVGDFPAETVGMMNRIALQAEKLIGTYSSTMTFPVVESVAEAIGHSACKIADNVKASAIITSTRSGSTAKIVSKFRPKVKIIAVTPSENVFNKLALIWGVIPLKIPFSQDTDLMIQYSLTTAREAGMVGEGEKVVITAGVPFGIEGLTNLIEVQEV